MFQPAAILGMWLRALLGIVLIGVAGWLFYRWYDEIPDVPDRNRFAQREEENQPAEIDNVLSWRPGFDQTTALLAGAICLSVVSVGGGAWLYPLLKRTGDDEPSAMRTGRKDRLRRPDGTEINIEEYGRTEGMPLVFTHGWGVDSTEWYYAKKALAQEFRLVLWDLPGTGHSTRAVNNDYSVPRFAEDLRAVVEWTGAPKVILIGHSLGGMILQTLASSAENRAQLAGLVLVHTTYTNPVRTTKHAGFYSAIERPVLIPLLHLTIVLSPLVWLMNWAAYLNGSTHRSTERQSFSGNECRGQLRFTAAFFPRQSPAVLARAMLGMLKFDERHNLPFIDVPTMVIPAERDPVTLREASDYLAHHLPKAKLALVRDGRHQAQMEFHTAFLSIIRDFAKSFDGRDSLTPHLMSRRSSQEGARP